MMIVLAEPTGLNLQNRYLHGQIVQVQKLPPDPIMQPESLPRGPGQRQNPAHIGTHGEATTEVLCGLPVRRPV